MKQIVNFSGGKDSTAMLHLMLERGEPIDEVIFFDGGWDWPQMYEHIDLVEKKTGLTITRLKPEHDFNYWFDGYDFESKNFGRLPGYGFPKITNRWCTAIKRKTITNHLRTHYTRGEIIQCIGFAVGEERRVKNIMTQKQFRFPLMEYNYDEVMCLLKCRELGYTFGDLYNYFDRVSCFCCPMKNNRELLAMKRHFPEQYKRIEAMSRSYCEKLDKINSLAWGGGTSGKVTLYQLFRPDQSFHSVDRKIRGKDET